MIFSVFLQYMLERPLWTAVILFSINCTFKVHSGISHALGNIGSGQTSLERLENCTNSHSDIQSLQHLPRVT